MWDALASRGYLGINLPGGVRRRRARHDRRWRWSARRSPPPGGGLLLIVVSPAIVGSILTRHGTPDQKDRWLPGIAAGTTKVAFAITEPDAGVELAQPVDGRAQDRRAATRCSGQKTYISGVEEADAILVIARMRMDDGQLGLPVLALVDADAPGMTKQHIPTAEPGANKQWQLFFDDVEVDADRLVGGESAGLKAAFDGLNPERIMGAAVCNGTARRALDAGGRVRARAQRLGPADRRAPGHLAPARAGEDRARAGAADDVQGGRALRRRAVGRRGVEHGEVRGGRGRASTASTRRSRRTAATDSRTNMD